MKPPSLKKITVRDYVDEISPHTFEGSLLDLGLWVKEQIKRHGPEARLDWDAHHYYAYDSAPSPLYHLIKDREETDEEFQKRLVEEAARAIAQVDHERALFESLKKKFEGDK